PRSNPFLCSLKHGLLRRCAPRNDELSPSRGAIRTRVLLQHRPRNPEGAGNAGCRPHPRALRAKEMHFCARKKPQGSQNNRHSLRDGLRLIRGLLGVPGLLASVASRSSSARLDASVGASGPHDFARPQEMLSSARQAALSTLASTASRLNVRDDREAPLWVRTGYVEGTTNFCKTEAQYFCVDGLT